VSGLALSTMWGINKFPNFADFFSAGAYLGFQNFELNHAVTSSMLNGIHRNSYTVTSVHEPCPADISVAQLKERDWFISSLDEENRESGVAAVKRSIDLAENLGARAVIVHPGRVDMDIAPDTRLRELYRAGKKATKEYATLKEEIMAARATGAERNVDAVRRSLVELAEHARRGGVRLGMEVRYHFFEIPLPDELELFLNLGYDDVVGFWYDVGHAETLDQMGFIPHEDWLRRFASRMVGVHLHDVIGIDDHRAAGLGQVDWDMVARYLPADVLRTCEFQNDNSPEQVVAGVKWLIEKRCATPA
jgi:sugar phosphate isomerase/epimerase